MSGLSLVLLAAVLPGQSSKPAAEVAVDLSGYSPECGIQVQREGERLQVAWPIAGDERGRLEIDLRPGGSARLSLGLAAGPAAEFQPLLSKREQVFHLTAGIRKGTNGRPPGMSIFNEFFDNPASRPQESHVSSLELKRASISSSGKRAAVVLGDLTLGPFRGELQLSLYAGSRLVHAEAVVATTEDNRAYIYSTLLEGDAREVKRFAWMDTEGRMQSTPAESQQSNEASLSYAARHRTIIAECERGSVACFPPPHQFFFPRDLTDNLKSVEITRLKSPGFGISQRATGGGGFVPWFNAPPGSKQRLGVFYLLTRGGAAEALRETLRYTNGDRFPELPGQTTLTSHWHMAVAASALEREKKGLPPAIPEFVKIFQDLGVQAVHLAEFHGDGHPGDPGPLRLEELDAMFRECRRLSSERLLFIPGEEGNDFLGLREPGKHPGHWMCIFPRPVYWTMKRAPGQPFVEDDGARGAVYHVGGRQDMVELLRREKGLAWSAHPRIKASSWTPDIFRREDFYLSDLWLGAAWKAMPADLSRERLGERGLDLLSDMANWGQKKYLLGEVDVFKIDHTHELYGHMNVNYLRLEQLPRYEQGFAPILDALRGGRFFTTTGEVLIREFQVGGKQSGETLEKPDRPPEVRVDLEWTFPLRFLAVVSGDGDAVHRERIDLSETGPFGRRAWTLRPDLKGRRWARLEAWDIAANGAYTQPVWLDLSLKR